MESFDRLSRQKLNASVSLFFDITSNGINLVTLSDKQLYKAGEAEFAQLIMSIVVMARANEESALKMPAAFRCLGRQTKGSELLIGDDFRVLPIYRARQMKDGRREKVVPTVGAH